MVKTAQERISQLRKDRAIITSGRAGLVSLHPPGAPLRLAHGFWRALRKRTRSRRSRYLPDALRVGGGVMRSRCAAKKSISRKSAGRAKVLGPARSLGVGDDEFSYAYDGDRCKLWHDGA